jgi:hypothetical protein
MIRRSTWIILTVFVLLLGALLIFQRVNQDDLAEVTDSVISEIDALEPVETLFPVPEGDLILGLRVEDAAGNILEINRKDESQAWELPGLDGDADQQVINRVISQLESLTIDRTLDPGIEMDLIGLATPAYTLRLMVSNGGVFTVYIGNVTITKTTYYAQMAGKSPIVVSKYGLDSVINLMTTLPVLEPPIPTPEILESGE